MTKKDFIRKIRSWCNFRYPNNTQKFLIGLVAIPLTPIIIPCIIICGFGEIISELMGWN